MRSILGMIFLFYLVGAYACKESCTTPDVSFFFSGFDSSDLKIIVLQKYQKNGAFSKLVDSIIYIDSNVAGEFANFDTVFFNPSYYSGFFLPTDVNYDYSISIPVTGAYYRVTGISIGNESSANTNDGCTKSLSAFVNGARQNSPEYPARGRNADIEISK